MESPCYETNPFTSLILEMSVQKRESLQILMDWLSNSQHINYIFT